VFDRLVQPPAQQRQRRQGGQVFADADRLGVQLQQFHLLGIGVGAQDQADRRFLARRPLMLVQPAQVQLDLVDVGGLERLELQILI
jgi:hypothetical protein